MKDQDRFDAVRLMRKIRDEISREIAGISYEEESRYIQNCLKSQRPPAKEKVPHTPTSGLNSGRNS